MKELEKRTASAGARVARTVAMAGKDVAHLVGVPSVFLQAVFHGVVGYRGYRRTLGLCLFLSLAAYVMLIVAGIFDEAAGLNGFGVLVTTPFTPPRGWTWLVPVSALLFVGLNVLLLERGRCTTLAAFMAALGVLAGGVGYRLHMHALIYSGPPDSPIALFAGYDPFNGLPWRHALPRFLIFNAYLLGLLLTAVYLMARLLRLGMDRLRLLLGVNVGVYAALTLGLALVTAPLHGYTTHLAHLRCKDNMAEIHSQLADQMKKHGGRLPAAATADGLFDALGLAGHQRRCHAGRVFFDDSRQLSVNTSLLGKGAGALRAAGDAVVVGCPYHAIGAEVKDTPLFRENIWLLSAVLASDLAGPKWNRQLAVQQEHWLRIKNMWDQRVRH